MTSIFNWFGSILGYLLWFFYNVIHNYGIAIILFTIVTKLLIFPFSVKQQKSMAANSKLALKQKELQKKFANDKMKLQEETAKLYEKENVNPMGGCLTTLIPFPIMLGIYYTVINPLQNVLHLGMDSINQATQLLTRLPGIGATFNPFYAQMDLVKHFSELKPHLTMFSAQDLDQITFLSKGFNFLGMNLLESPNSHGFFSYMILIPALCLITSLASQYIMMKLQPGMEQAQQGCMKYMLYLMPLFSAWLAYTLPAAVGFYWIMQTLVSFVQTLVLNRFYSPADITAKAEAQRIALRELEESGVKPLAVPLRIEQPAAEQPSGKKKQGAQTQAKKQGNRQKRKTSDYMGSKK